MRCPLENRRRTALLVSDVQNGIVGNAYEREHVIANIQTLVDKARAEEGAEARKA